MAVTLSPQALRSKPILLAVTPLPRPLTTPPVTSTYFIYFLYVFLFLALFDDKQSRAEQPFQTVENGFYVLVLAFWFTFWLLHSKREHKQHRILGLQRKYAELQRSRV